MHENDREGIIHGTVTQLSRLCRCNEQEMTAAVDELNSTKTAHVTFCNNDVTVENRRMKREYNERKATNIRVKRHRAKEATGLERECNAPETVHISSSSSISVSKDTNTLAPSRKKTTATAPDDSPVILTFPMIDNSEYPITENVIKEMQPLFPAVNVENEFRKMKAWLTNNPNNRKKNVKKFYNAWLSRAQDKAPVIAATSFVPFEQRTGAERIVK
jgi:hypothetical protein